MTRARTAAILSLLLLPLVWLWPCVFGGRTFVPYDVAQFPPASITATDDQLAAARDGSNLDVTEVPVWFLPEMELARDELAAGHFPGWNPHARTGAPLHAHGLIGLLYPPNWLALFADDPAGRLGILCWCNLAIGGLLAFGLFRQLGLGLLPAWLGAMLFELSGPMAANGFFWMRLGSYVWLPGVLWAMLRIAAQQDARPLPVLLLGACFAMPWLAGFPPFAATTTVFAGGTLVWLLIERWRQHDRRAALRLALELCGGLLLGACLALPQVLPSLLFFPESARPTTPMWRDIAGQAFEPYGLLGYLMPNAFGHPSTMATLPYQQAPMQLLLNTRSDLDGKPALPNYNFTEYTVFVSTLGIVLAVLGFALGRGHRASLGRAALLLALGLGLFLPGFTLLFHLPVVQNVWPIRWPAAATLFVAWLAASGCQRLLIGARRVSAAVAGVVCVASAPIVWLLTTRYADRHLADPSSILRTLASHYACSEEAVVSHVQAGAAAGLDRFAVGFANFASNGMHASYWLLASGVGLLVLAFLRNQRHREVLLLVGAAASAVQLGAFGASFSRGAIRELSTDSPVHAFLREQATARQATGGFTIVRASRLPGLPDQLPPGQLMVPGIRDLNFYSHADARMLQPVAQLLDRYQQQLGLGDNAGERIAGKGYLTASLPAALLRHPLFDLLGVRYALATAALPELGEPVGPAVSGRGTFYVYERPRALPRAFIVPEAELRDTDAAVLAELTDETLDASRQVFVVASDFRPVAAPGLPPGPSEPRTVTFVSCAPSHLELDVAAGHGPYLVLAETWLPGWTATVDGQPTEIMRCNHSQQLIVIPSSACRVSFRYATPGLTAGFVLAAIATLLALLWTFTAVRRLRRDHRHNEAKPPPQAKS